MRASRPCDSAMRSPFNSTLGPSANSAGAASTAGSAGLPPGLGLSFLKEAEDSDDVAWIMAVDASRAELERLYEDDWMACPPPAAYAESATQGSGCDKNARAGGSRVLADWAARQLLALAGTAPAGRALPTVETAEAQDEETQDKEHGESFGGSLGERLPMGNLFVPRVSAPSGPRRPRRQPRVAALFVPVFGAKRGAPSET